MGVESKILNNKGEIDKETLEQLLENANMAPTHKMTQPWFFKIYKNKAKARLGQAMAQAIEAQNSDDTRAQEAEW